MSYQDLNLATRRFANTRPVVRVAALLWAAAVALTATNAVRYAGSFSGLDETTEALATVESRLDRADAAIDAAQQELARLDIEEQNLQVQYLNAHIHRRVFGWGVLFERLAAGMPEGARLLSLGPRVQDGTSTRRSSRGRRDEPKEYVDLAISAEVKSDEDIIDWLEALFNDPAFDSPRLPGENRDEGVIKIRLEVRYDPRIALAALDPGAAEIAAVAEEGVVDPRGSEVPPLVATDLESGSGGDGGQVSAPPIGAGLRAPGGLPVVAGSAGGEDAASAADATPSPTGSRPAASPPAVSRRTSARTVAPSRPDPSRTTTETSRAEPEAERSTSTPARSLAPAVRFAPNPVPQAVPRPTRPPRPGSRPSPRPTPRPTPLSPNASGERRFR